MTDNDLWNGWQVIGRGANRVCVELDDAPDQCLKFVVVDGQPAPAARWPKIAGALAAELALYQALRRRHGPDLDAHFAACLAVEPTRYGPALRCRRVQHADGRPARSLYQQFDDPRSLSRPALGEAIDRLEAFLRGQGIPLFDVNPANLLAVERPGGAIDLVVVDLKSALKSKEWVPLSRWLPFMRDRKLARRFARLRRRLDDVRAAAVP